jgi:hypothetical protein
MTTQTEITLRGHRRALRFFWSLLIGATTVSLIGNITHAVLPYIPRHIIQIGAAAVPPVILLAAVHGHRPFHRRRVLLGPDALDTEGPLEDPSTLEQRVDDSLAAPADIVDMLARHRASTDCGITIYYLGAVHHAFGCDEHRGCENYQKARGWPYNGEGDGLEPRGAEEPNQPCRYRDGMCLTHGI